MANVYKEKGYANRKAYVVATADDYGVPHDIAIELANALGSSEDFDGLLSALEDASSEVWA